MITLHHFPQTRSMRSLWLLNELGIAFEVIERPLDKGLRSPSYLKLNPIGRVPALEMDGQVIFETGAITQLLCDRYSPDVLGRRPDAKDRAEWLIWLHFAETLSQHTAALTQQHLFLYEDHMRSPTVMRLEAARVGKCFDAIELRLERRPGAKYLLDDFSATDVSVAQAVYMARHFRKTDGHPSLTAWFERCTERPAFKASLPSDERRFYARDFYPAWED